MMMDEVFSGACRVDSKRIDCSITVCQSAINRAKQALENTKARLLTKKERYWIFWERSLWDKWCHNGSSFHGLRKLAPDLMSEEDVKILDNEWRYRRMISDIEVFRFEGEVFLNPRQLQFIKEWE